MATREAMALGLDRDDTVIRRRLRQKLEFVAEDTFDAAPATEAELQAWLDAHPDAFRTDAQVAFRQVYLSRTAAAPPSTRTPGSCWRGSRLPGRRPRSTASATP